MKTSFTVLGVLLLIALSLGTVNASTVIPPPPPEVTGPTSLETMVSVSGGNGFASGSVSVTNVGENTAKITVIQVAVEIRKDNTWVEVGRVTLMGQSLTTGASTSFPFSLSFQDDPYAKAHRVVSYVTLANHPSGSRTFVSRTSF